MSDEDPSWCLVSFHADAGDQKYSKHCISPSFDCSKQGFLGENQELYPRRKENVVC